MNVKRWRLVLGISVIATALAACGLTIHDADFACHYYTEDKGCEYDAVFTAQIGPVTYCNMRMRPGSYEPSWCEARPSFVMHTPSWQSWWRP